MDYRDRRGQSPHAHADRLSQLENRVDLEYLLLHGGLEIGWAVGLRIWWSIAWRTVVVTLLSVLAVGSMAATYLNHVGGEWPISAIINTLMLLFSVPAGIWAVKSVLNKDFRDYRLLLLPSHRLLIERERSASDRR